MAMALAIAARAGGSARGLRAHLGLDLLIRDVEANKQYVVPAPLDIPCGITAIGWSEDREIPLSLMGGWNALTANCRLVLLDGGHFSFLAAPPALLAQIARDLAGGAGVRGPA